MKYVHIQYKKGALRCGDGYVVRHLIDNIQLLDGKLVDLVQHVYARDVAAVALDDVDQLVDRGIAATEDVGRVDLVLLAYEVHHLVRQDGLGDHGLEVNGAFLLTPCFAVSIIFEFV